jgi:hypothetical protein
MGTPGHSLGPTPQATPVPEDRSPFGILLDSRVESPLRQRPGGESAQ